MDIITGRLVGLATGIIVGLLICYIAAKKMNKNGKIKTEYDERQKEIRGKGYKCGFWAETIFFAILMILDVAEVKIPAVNTVIYFTGFMFGAIVLFTYCIWNGAYFGINNNVKSWTIFLSIVGIFNLFIGYMSYRDGELIFDGILGTGFINILCGVMILFAVLVYFIKKLVDAREVLSDEES